MSEFWNNRSTLVTGASGLLGGWLARSLIASGADVTCLLRDWVPESQLIGTGIINRVKVIRGDLQDQELLERMLGEHEVDTVFHLAAQTIVGIANRNPVSTLETNIRGTWCLLEACRRSPGVRQIVLASSDKAYGDQTHLPYDEDTPLEGRHPYDVSKSCADLIAKMYAVTYNLPVVVTRCGNFYGGGDLNWNRIVPGTIRSIIQGTNPVLRSDGKSIRDYFYVEDGVAAYLHLAERFATDRSLLGEAFNFSNEFQMTALELVHTIIRRMKSDLVPEVRNEATNEIAHQYLSSQKARNRLGWCPAFSLDEGLGRTICWYKDYFTGRSRDGQTA
jgi:CDP-glucose 4,6-dehydratase